MKALPPRGPTRGAAGWKKKQQQQACLPPQKRKAAKVSQRGEEGKSQGEAKRPRKEEEEEEGATMSDKAVKELKESLRKLGSHAARNVVRAFRGDQKRVGEEYVKILDMFESNTYTTAPSLEAAIKKATNPDLKGLLQERLSIVRAQEAAAAKAGGGPRTRALARANGDDVVSQHAPLIGSDMGRVVE